ncbi:MAG: type II toxin-antitoxin system RelE/ParE family toxin [Candidatus Cloacimonetes bacterium]|nr:type II toxin-antitoxin system RelE/ParE family toxin [Candidatus Cloacimonadota bacterium]
MYKVEYSHKVEKFLDKQSDRFIKRFEKSRKKLQINPYRKDMDIKKLKGFKNDYRLRIGKYRFIYAIIENRSLIYFYHASSRGDIY